MKKPVVLGFNVFCFLAASLALAAALPQSIMPAAYVKPDDQNATFVDIRDLVQFRNNVPEAKIILASMLINPSLYFPKNVVFGRRGAGISLDKKRFNTVYGVEFSTLPKLEPAGQNSVQLTAFLHEKSRGFYFSKFQVFYNLTKKTVLSVKHLDEIPVGKTNFIVTVGLAHRKVILHDPRNNITKVYPIGVGSIDFGVRANSGTNRKIVSMTPQFRNARMDSDSMFVAMKKDIYQNMPLLPITLEGTNTPSPEAFHIIQHAKRISPSVPAYDFNYMVRGFDSHGCIRLREKDLYEFYALVKFSGERSTKINIYNWVPMLPEHPYPLNEAYYQSVKNKGTKARPHEGFDSERLTVLEKKNGAPPVASLQEHEVQ